MDSEERNRIRDGLARIAAEAHDSQQGAQRAYDMARNLEGFLSYPWPEPEPEPDPVPTPPAPEPETHSGIDFISDGEGLLTIGLTRSARESANLRRIVIGSEVLREGGLFVEQFVTEAAGVRETVCILHNGRPEGRGAIRIAALSIKTHDGREVFPYADAVTIPPGRPEVVRDYYQIGGTVRLSQRLLQQLFWDSLASNAHDTPGQDFEDLLTKELEHQLKNPITVGPYDVAWDARGDGVGGQGIEPDAMDWRHCSAGYALAALTAYRSMNRCSRVMTDADGKFGWDKRVQYTSVGSFMPESFKWTPQTTTEHELSRWWNIDGQHFHRAYRDALWLAELTQHPVMLWYLEMLANHQVACHVGTAGDGSSSGWWSLPKKIMETNGRRNEHCGRQGVHELRFLLKVSGLFRHADINEALRSYLELFRLSIDTDGCAHELPVSANPAAPADWASSDATALVNELQLAQRVYEESGDSDLIDAAEDLKSFYGAPAERVWNYTTRHWGLAYGRWGPVKDMSLMTHGQDALEAFYGNREGMLKVARTRGVEAGGAQPLNYCRDPEMWRAQ